MANPSYSLDNITFHTMPGAYRLGGRPRSREQSVVALETDNLKQYVYDLGTRQVWELHFRLKDSELDFFDDLDVSVNGAAVPFYFSLSGVGSGDSVFVRKEPGFDPQELDEPLGDEMGFDYVLRLKQEL